MNHLLREHAPITEAGWERIDDEARERLTPALAARKLVDFAGPHGWEHSATNLGRVERVAEAARRTASTPAQRRVLPLVELRAPFTIAAAELADADRGAEDVDLDALDEAAHRIAVAENAAVFHGWKGGRDRRHRRGLAARRRSRSATTASATRATSPRRSRRCSRRASTAPTGSRSAPRRYTRVLETTEHGGYPLLDHLRKILGGPLVWAPGVDGAVVVSLRGGDFLFESGEDLSIGYDRHDAEAVQLYLEESFSFRVATPEAAVALTA